MMQTELWMLTPFFVLTLIKVSLINADSSKSQRKLNDQEENYIITHYGREYYTPVTDSNVQQRNSGYFTAEVIPVDVNTGEELNTVKNIFVPMHTGYSIAPNNAGHQHQQQQQQQLQQSQIHNKIASSNKKSPATTAGNPQWSKESTAAETSPKETNADTVKSKIPKKFKNQIAYGAKKKLPVEFNESIAPERLTESVQNIKNIPKRHVGEISREFLPPHLFNRRFESPERRWSHANYFY